MQNLVKKKWFLPVVLVSLSFFQLIYSFSFPSVGFSDNWLPVDTYLPKFEVESSDTFLLEKVSPFISENYRLNSDVGHYIETGKNFNPEYFENHVLLSRPLYPFLIFLVSLPLRLFLDPSHGIIFALAILVNFILLTLASLLFFVLLKKIFSLKTAFLSSVLLIFSPLVHSALIQPRAELLTVFAVIAAAYLFYKYIKAPSTFKFIAFSLIIGVFMLAKMFFALPLFLVILAIYFRRYTEGFSFFVIHLVPFGLWHLFVTQVWKIPFYVHEAQYYKSGIWFLHIFQWPWYQTLNVFLGSFPSFVESITYSFLLIPIIFSVLGFQRLNFSAKSIFYFGSMFSVLLFSLLTTVYYYRITFLLFPIIYPTCVLGINEAAVFLKKYQRLFYPLVYIIAVGVIIIISSVNAFHFVTYL